MKKNKIIFRFGIWGFDVPHDTITKCLELQPLKVYVKGERMNSKFLPIAKNNGWVYQTGLGEYAPFEDQVNSMLDVLEPKKDILKKYGEQYTCEFSLALFVHSNNEESTPWVHLGPRYIQFIRDVKVEFDLDLYCS